MPKQWNFREGERPKWDFVRTSGEVLCTHYRAGTIVHHIPVTRSNPPPPKERGTVIRDMSAKSRGNAAFKFGNADVAREPVEWCAMIVLTWHQAPDAATVKPALKRFARLWRAKWAGEGVPAWIMEMQERGVPHYHLFVSATSRFGAQCVANVGAGVCREVQRKGRVRTVVGGNLEKWIVRAWLEASGQQDDRDARWFHGWERPDGGIVEMFESQDAAGRYVAKESAKREQKVLPERYHGGLGRWWHLAKTHRPSPRKRGFASLDLWPWAKPYARIWQTEKLGEADFGSWELSREREAAPHVARWIHESGQSFTLEFLDALSTRCREDMLLRRGECHETTDMRTRDEVADDYAESVAAMHLSRLRTRRFASCFRQ